MFCSQCGQEIEDRDKFCWNCGSPIKLRKENTTNYNVQLNDELNNGKIKEVVPTVSVPYDEKAELPKIIDGLYRIERYEGKHREFSFASRYISIKPALDIYNYYRKIFKHNAQTYAELFENEYRDSITSLEEFLNLFSEIYSRNIWPLFHDAVKILNKYDVFEVTEDSFSEMFYQNYGYYCQKTLLDISNAVNGTITSNQQNAIDRYNSKPTLFGIGLVGIAAISIYDDIQKSNFQKAYHNASKLTSFQEKEIFGRIHTFELIENAYQDYFNVHILMLYLLREHGHEIWLPTEAEKNKAEAMVDNIMADLPAEEVADKMERALLSYPYSRKVFRYIVESDILSESDREELKRYFGYNRGSF